MRTDRPSINAADLVTGTIQRRSDSSGRPIVERRKHLRHVTALSVTIFWRDESGLLREMPGIVRDVSAGGFGIEVDYQFHAGQALSVETQSGTLKCQIRHVQERQDGSLVGVEVLLASDASDQVQSLRKLSQAFSELQ